MLLTLWKIIKILLSLLLLLMAACILYMGLFAKEYVDAKAFGASALLVLMATMPWATSKNAISPKFILWLSGFSLVGFSIYIAASEINFPMSCSHGTKGAIICQLINYLHKTGGNYLALLPFFVLGIICINCAYGYKGKSRET